MNHHGVDASEGHVHHHGSHGSAEPAPPTSVHEGHHSHDMSHPGSHGELTKHGHHEGGGHDMSMAMFFHTGDAETILFKFWRTESAMALTLSCLLIFVFAVLYEALKFFREWLFAWDRKRLAGGRDQYNPPRRYREANYNYNQPTYPPRINPQSGTQIYAYRPRAPSMPPLQQPLQPPGPGSPQPHSSLILIPHTHQHIQENTPPAGRTSKLKVYCSGMHILQTFLHVLQVLISFLLMLVFMTFNVWLCVAVLLGAGVGYYIFCAFRTNVQEHCN
ncbi:high affinity copper uptake protein 1 [Drosophila yakuba]|uniref:Copper transport protein n=1 Tax=Drosophila yakuba TaxID=7245 RepID=B4PMN5_DROYA|nr:high affinity copper uptake protein 1 [Drosophila yakuba]EDW99169.1 uncharacterized protein Dyak_GE23348 [Drosophila yakuba]